MLSKTGGALNLCSALVARIRDARERGAVVRQVWTIRLGPRWRFAKEGHSHERDEKGCDRLDLRRSHDPSPLFGALRSGIRAARASKESLIGQGIGQFDSSVTPLPNG